MKKSDEWKTGKKNELDAVVNFNKRITILSG
jgi:hypothetical protein